MVQPENESAILLNKGIQGIIVANEVAEKQSEVKDHLRLFGSNLNKQHVSC